MEKLILGTPNTFKDLVEALRYKSGFIHVTGKGLYGIHNAYFQISDSTTALKILESSGTL